MATAREKLYDEIVALSDAPMGDDAESLVRKVMARYRVQTKPGVNIADGTTARDALGDRLLELWRQRPSDKNQKLGEAIDEFRMQIKQRGAPSKPPPKRPAPPAPAPEPRREAPSKPVAARAETPPPPAASPAARPAAPLQKNGDTGEEQEPSFARAPGGRRGAEPVAGGPRRRGRSRGECPKCHSMGVVLARSYAGDEYYSCIYCGWQAFKPADESDPTASLAVRLLGQSAGEKS